jgi:hypothetical protein
MILKRVNVVSYVLNCVLRVYAYLRRGAQNFVLILVFLGARTRDLVLLVTAHVVIVLS